MDRRLFMRWEYRRHTWKQYAWSFGIALTANVLTLAYFLNWIKQDSEDDDLLDRYIGRELPSETERLQYFAECCEVYDSDIGQREKLIGVENGRDQLFCQVKGDILEIAAGTGRNYSAFLRGQSRITSLTMQDCIPAMLDVARKKLDDQNFSTEFPVRFDVGDAHELPYADSSFDTVVMSFAISSIERPEQALAEANRVLKPTGRILFFDRGLNRYGWVRWIEDVVNTRKTNFEWESGQYINRPLLKYFNQMKFPIISWHTTLFGFNWTIIAGKSQYLEARRQATIAQMKKEFEEKQI